MSDVRVVGPLCGVLFAVLFILTVILVGDTGDDAEGAVRVLTEQADRFLAAFVAGTLSTAALLGFFAWLRELVREAAPQRRLLAALVLTPVAASAASLIGSLALMAGAAEAADGAGTSPEVAEFVMNAQYVFLVGGFMLAGLATVCAGLGLRRSGTLPDALCWAGVVVGILQLVAFVFLPMLLLLLWVLVTAIVLLTRRSRVAAGSGAPA